MTSHDFSTAEQVRAYLAAHHADLGAVADVALLSGGHANYVWAIDLVAPFDNLSQLVLKYHPPHARAFTTIALPQDRSSAEFAALSEFHRIAHETPGGTPWKVPRPLRHDRDRHAVLMERVHGTMLLDFFRAARPAADTDRLGEALAAFLAVFRGMPEPVPWFANAEMQAFCDGRNDVSALAAKFDLPDAAEWVARALGPHGYARPAPRQLIFGDYWPNSVIVHLDDPAAPAITVIDWECHRYGHHGQDLAQFMANLFLMREGEPYHTGSVDALMRAFVQHARPLHADLDHTALTVARVVELAPYPHWGLTDPKAAVRKATTNLHEYYGE
ncbi:hypothetical protein H9P43_004761 [Blastocladiella emersonii ATCC 22665]|nr:hypothetical protein H9P43_004761 [Blastocladiella emersonii ATCC 22665]